MKLFDFMRKRKPEEMEVVSGVSTEPERNTYTVTYKTGWPIDVVYGHLHKNYEEQGFGDAMRRGDLAFKEVGMDIIRKEILLLFREVNLKYDTIRQDILLRIKKCIDAGLVTIAAEFENKLQVINKHQEELEGLENDFVNNVGGAANPLHSYECGYLRGLAAKALGDTSADKFEGTPSASYNNIPSIA